MTAQRPRPEQLLQQAQKEEQQAKRGKLKIYFGAAPGVGKTYTMLQDALAKREQGLDVVIGVVESHGRKEIEALLKDFTILPLQVITYREKPLLEFDLDAALKRMPGLILIDEMAHTNAPGVRHKKRWQDIKELLDRGIDVYTTLNVQHIESLNETVAQIIGTTIRETVPDSMLELADVIELVDLPVEDLLKRLEDGKVYFPAQAEIATRYFFRKGNLTALRELALRVTAEHVDSQMLLYRQGQGIKPIWPTKEKILVCIGPGAESIKHIHSAKRTAAHLHTDWFAVHVDTPQRQLSPQARHQVNQNLRLAEQLGAQTRILTGFDIVKEIMEFAHEQNITQIVIGKRIRPRWRNLLFRDLADEIVRQSGEIDVFVITGELGDYPANKPMPAKPIVPWKIYAGAIGIVAFATGIDFSLFPYLSDSNLIMVYLLGITAVALFARTGPSILASLLSVLAYDFFFVPPLYSFAVSDVQYFFTLLVMLLVTQVIGHLTVLLRRQAELARSAERQTSALLNLSRQLASTRGVDKLLTVGARIIAEIFACEVMILLPENGHLIIRIKHKTDEVLNTKEQSIAQWVFEIGQAAGLGTDTLAFSNALYMPLSASQGTVGVLRLRPINTGQILISEQIHLLESYTNQLALALEVDRLQEQIKIPG